MSPEIENRLLRAEDLPGLRLQYSYELVAGRIAPMSPTGVPHGIVVGNVNALLVEHARRIRLGKVITAEAGFLVHRDPDTVRAPDLAFLSTENLRRGKAAGETFFPFAPDLAVEVLSPDDAWETVEKKAREYLAAEGKAVWVISPTLRKAYVFEPGKPGRVLESDDAIEGGDALPGFRAQVSEFFEDA